MVFCHLTLQELEFTFSFDSMLNTSLSGVHPYNHHPNVIRTRPQRHHLSNSGRLLTQVRLSSKRCKRRNQDPILFLITNDCEPLVLYKPPDSSRKAQLLRSEPTLSLSPHLSISSNSVSENSVRWAKKAKIFGQQHWGQGRQGSARLRSQRVAAHVREDFVIAIRARVGKFPGRAFQKG